MEETNLFGVKNNPSTDNNIVSGASKDFFRTSWTVAKYLSWNNLLGKTCKEIKDTISDYPDMLMCFEDCVRYFKYLDTDMIPMCKIDYDIDLLYEASSCATLEDILRLFYSGGVDDKAILRLDSYVKSEQFSVSDTLKKFIDLVATKLYTSNFVTFKKLYEFLCKELSIHSSVLDERLQGDVYYRSVSTDHKGQITTKSKTRKALVDELRMSYIELPNEFNDGVYSYVKESIFSSKEDYYRETAEYYNADLLMDTEPIRLYGGYKICLNEFKFSLSKICKSSLSAISSGDIKISRPCRYESIGDLCINIFNKEDYSNGILTALLGLDDKESTDLIYNCITKKDKVGLNSFDKLVPTLKDFKLSILKAIVYKRMFEKGECTSLQDIDTLIKLQVELSNPKVSEKEYTKLHSMYFNQLKEIEEKYKIKSDLVVNTCVLTYIDVYYNSKTKSWGDFMDNLVANLFK